MHRISIILAAVTVLCALPAGAAIYKWVDKDGTTHYTETPPPNVDARELPIAEPSAAPPAAQEPAAAGAETVPGAPAPKSAAERAREQEGEDKRAADMRKTYCAIAQRNVTILESPNPVVELNGQGEQMFVTDEQRAAALTDAKRRVQTYCTP